MDQQTIPEISSTGRHQECLQACQQLLQSEAENTLPWKYAGKSLVALGQFEKAHQYLVKAHELDNQDPEILKDIGNIFLNLGCTDDAKKWYTKALEVNNKYAPAINNLADIQRQSGNNKEAADLFKQAIETDPPNPGISRCGSKPIGIRRSRSGANNRKKSHPISKLPGINEILGIIFQNKKFPEAIESYQEELVINPQSIPRFSI